MITRAWPKQLAFPKGNASWFVFKYRVTCESCVFAAVAVSMFLKLSREVSLINNNVNKN
jgi:hypothetical protein